MSTSLRERQRQMTSDLIVDAVAEVLVEQGVHSFSMDEVASRAGVSLRTLYRYFESREALLSAVGQRFSAVMEADGHALEKRASLSLAQSMELLASRFSVCSEHDTLARAAVALITYAEQTNSEELSIFGEARQRRHDALRLALRRELPHLDDDVHDQLFAVARLLASTVGWSHLTAPPARLEPRAAGVAVQWALQTLLARARELQREGIESLEEDLR